MARRTPPPAVQPSLFSPEEVAPRSSSPSPSAWPAVGQTTLVYLAGLPSHPPLPCRVLQILNGEYTVEFTSGPLKGRVVEGARIKSPQVERPTPPDDTAPF